MMGMHFNSVRRFHFQQLIVEHDPSGRIPLSTLRVFWRAATRAAQEYSRESARAFSL